MTEFKTKNKVNNTFRFCSFAQRIKEIDLRHLALYHVGHINEELSIDATATYFHQTLTKWMSLNLSEEFAQFSRRVAQIVSLPQLLHQQQFVIDELLQHLSKASSLSMQSLLELLYILAKDLREDFYPYFQRTLKCLISLLHTQDAEQLEWCFVCLAHLFKLLKPYLKRNIGVVFHCILPLLDEQQYGEHINNFAVECFSFIARNVRDYGKFIDFILCTLVSTQVESLQACGRLLFEMMRGVPGQFHSTAGDFLQFIFEQLTVDKTKRPQQQTDLLIQIVSNAIKHLLNFITPQQMTVFWTQLCLASDKTQCPLKLANLIRIFLQVVDYRDGKYLTDVNVVVPCILRMLDHCMLVENASETLKDVTHLIGCMLLSNSGLLTQLDSSRLLRKVLSIKNRKVYEQFIQQILPYGQFDILVLPSLIEYFEEYFDAAAIELMANIIIQKFPLAFNGLDIDTKSINQRKRTIRLKHEGTINKIQLYLRQFDLPNVLNNEEQLLLILIISHVDGFTEDLIKQPLVNICDKLVQQLTTCIPGIEVNGTNDVESKQELEKARYCLHLCCAIQYQWQFSLKTDLIDAIVSYMLRDTQIDLTQIQHLSFLNLIITHNSHYIRKSHSIVINRLATLLAHFHHNVRLLAAHSLHCLYAEQKTRTPYHVFYQAELIDINVHTYREHLLQLEKLSVDGGLFKAFQDLQYKQHTLQFLFGQLFNNFKIIWEPILKLLSDYAKDLCSDIFWQVYQRQLQLTIQGIDYHENETNTNCEIQSFTSCLLWKSKTINELFRQQYNTQQNQIQQKHLLNYRNLLWQALPQFGNIFVLKNRELVSIVLNFIHNEYQQLIELKENFWDLTACDENNYNETHEFTEEGECEQQNDGEEFDSLPEKALEDFTNVKPTTPASRKYKSSVGSWQTKAILLSLETILKVLAAHNNPKALYREPELWQLYMQLLRHSNSSLQKLALDCVMSYKIKICVTHKEFLYRIIDDKTLKDALISFQLDAITVLDQRENFMKILLRLLYGKMFARGNTKGMSNQQRKAIILRFLGQCSIEEIEWFLEMSFGLYNAYTATTVDILQIPSMVRQNFTLQAVPSPKKLQSALNLWELMRKEFIGAMQSKFHDYMLKLLVFIGSLCNETLLANCRLAHTKMPSVFRNVKQKCLQALWNFCDHLQEYDWSDQLVHCITEVFVFPNLAKLPQDSIHSPTLLLKLLLQWSEKPKFFKYLQQQHPECNDSEGKKTIFHYIIDLYLNERTELPVRKTITDMIERLLVANENHLEFAECGLALIKPHIARILQRLKMSFGCRPNRQSLHKQNLNILSLLTKHVETSHCDQLLQLLLPILIAKSQLSGVSSEVIVQIITTLSNLIKRLNCPEVYLAKLAPLFEQVQDVVGRKELCNLVADMARIKHKQQPDSEITLELKNTARILILLNAFDKRWVEQPDYDKRLQALQEVKQQMNSSTGLNYNLGVILIYNCYYILRYDKDMGLRDNASELLHLVIPYLIQKYTDDQCRLTHLMENVVLAVIKRSIHSPNANLRYVSIRLLGVLARKCHTAHPVLNDLRPLTCIEDEEVDFFENIIHLQLHKHGRALNRFCSLAAKFTQTPHVYTLTQVIIPLASCYLLREQPNAKHTLIDAAIETVGIACQLLPWQHYYTVLRFYLQKLRHCPEYQKQCVRIVVRILDAFHFDLSANQTNAAIETSEGVQTEIDKHKENSSHCKDPNALSTEKTNGTDEMNQSDLMEPDMTVETALDELETNFQNLNDDGDDDNAQTENSCQSDVAKPVPCLNVLLRMKPSTSRHILHTIQHLLIPALNHAIIEPSTYDTQHKVNRKRLGMEREEEEIMRVPIALALVKLMQKLPKSLLENSLPGVFMKVCQFLKSPLKSVRMLTRDILKKIIVCLGAEYLALLIHHLQTLLTKGFQVHVLSVTIHGVLEALRDHLQPAHIECCMQNLLDVALNDIFGEVSAEKEIDKLTVHTPEAKPSAKSYLVLHIIARNIQENCIMDLMMPFKQHLSRSKSRKLTLKIQDCFSKIVGGLVENSHIARDSLLIFTYGTISESIADLLPGAPKHKLSDQEKEQIRRARPDCFIIPPEPRMRSGIVNKQVVTSAQANAHILIEFGLELLHTVLKRKKLMDLHYASFLNPLLPLLKDALNSSHIRVTTYALKCFASLWVEDYQLNEMKRPEFIQNVVDRLFEIMYNFSKFGATKQEENIQLTKATFKAIVALLRKCQFYNFTKEQINQLVFQVEQDLHDNGSNSAMTFTLLKAMLIRKINLKPMHGVMKKVAELSVTSQSDYVRNESCNAMLIYIMEYPICKKVNDLINFYSVQLCYSQTAGRLSAIQLLTTIIKKFPVEILNRKAEFLYLSLGTRLVNDTEPECRKAVAVAIELLITRSEKTIRQKLFDMSVIFLRDAHKPSVREMGAALCSRFVNVERHCFRARLSDILPILINRLQSNNPQAPGRFVKAPINYNLFAQLSKQTNEMMDAEKQEQIMQSIQRSLDHEIIQLQYTLLKIFENCAEQIFEMSELTSNIDDLAYECQRQLAHDHNWVRCNAVKILNHILSHYNFATIGRKLSLEKDKSLETKNMKLELNDEAVKLDFIYLNPEYDIKSLVLDLCAQLIPGDVSDIMCNEIVKIFLYIANMLSDVPFVLKKENVKSEIEELNEKEDKLHNAEEQEQKIIDSRGGKINLYWLIRQLRFCINKEIAKAPHSTVIRTASFKLIEGLITLLNVEVLERLAMTFLMILVREMNEEDQNIDDELRQLAVRVGNSLRKRIGADIYDNLRTKAILKLSIRRAERKKTLAQEKINDPLRASKRKASIQLRKKSAKKLKISIKRGKSADIKNKFLKRKRKHSHNGDDEYMKDKDVL